MSRTQVGGNEELKIKNEELRMKGVLRCSNQTELK
jgi:hypothetical protein